MKVLIAEDDLTSQVVLESILKKLGFEVLCVSHGVEAQAILNSPDPPRLVILDRLLPDMDVMFTHGLCPDCYGKYYEHKKSS